MALLTILDILEAMSRVSALVLLLALIAAVKNMPTNNEEIRVYFRGNSRSEAEKRWLR